jgi:predicted HD phosphohydrolase
MCQANFDAMSDEELKRHFLANRQDQAVFQAYMDRFNQRPKSVIASPGDPDFDAKIQAAIRQKLEASRSKRSAKNAVEQAE